MGSTNVSLDLASQTGEHLHISKMNALEHRAPLMEE